jgi:putative FmdB family regulatory protein
MPIREYKCKKCGNIFENLEIDLRDGNAMCPNCRSKNVEKVFSLFSRSSQSKSSCDITKRFG